MSGHDVAGAATDESRDRQVGVGGDRDQVAEAAAAQDARFGEQADVAEDRAESGDLRAGELQGWAVGDVRDVDAAGSEDAMGLGRELRAGEVGGGAGAGEDVADDDVGAR